MIFNYIYILCSFLLFSLIQPLSACEDSNGSEGGEQKQIISRKWPSSVFSESFKLAGEKPAKKAIAEACEKIRQADIIVYNFDNKKAICDSEDALRGDQIYEERDKMAEPRGKVYVMTPPVIKSFFRDDAQEKSVHTLIKKAAKGDAEKQFKLSNCYAKGKGVMKDTKKAALFLLLASQQEYPKALDKLGSCYEDGKLGFPINRELAIYWHQRNAKLKLSN